MTPSAVDLDSHARFIEPPRKRNVSGNTLTLRMCQSLRQTNLCLSRLLEDNFTNDSSLATGRPSKLAVVEAGL
ncbi:hypothetical protein AZE42_02749 [Rhizopogon vesiculosus]|uniref:Uncharacterized protein n=1 Tax=Rhizopogon vesiculosus TaxID=180088 RepID=A0A1J8PFW7_9AGAM|nr:hypothetical protein AZE42_02749 [Rhizopogon vesiculosus]